MAFSIYELVCRFAAMCRGVRGRSDQPPVNKVDSKEEGQTCEEETKAGVSPPELEETETSAPGSDRPFSPSVAEPQADQTNTSAVDDLTVVRGIGLAIQKRLIQEGITTYAQLANADPKDVRNAVENIARGAKVEQWIEQAKRLAGG